jgi:hypothetical protein
MMAMAPPGKPVQASINGVLPAQSLSTLQSLERAAAEAADAAVAASKKSDSLVVTNLASQLRKHWSAAKQAKEPIEREMLSAVRSRRGEYDPDKLAQLRAQGSSEIYMMLFSTKARQLKALVSDILVGDGADKPWSIRPTPKPQLPPKAVSDIRAAIEEETQKAMQMGVPMAMEDVRQRIMDMKQEAEQRMMEMARLEAEDAEDVIEDALVEGGFLLALDEFLDDLPTFKTACIKGPIMRTSNELTWDTDQDGRPVAVVKPVVKRFYERVDPFMLYPASWAKSVHDGYLFERHRLSRGDLYAMIGVDGYNEEAIRAVIEQHGQGGLHEWLSIDTEKASAEGRENAGQDMLDSELIDALQYWGSVSGAMLREWGMPEEEVPDEAKEYEVEAWLIGSHVIKAVINPDPLNRRPYYTDGFSKIPGAFWHNSLFDVIRDCQDMCNATARALVGNMGIASGPQVYVMRDRLAPGEEVSDLFPWKIWQVTSDPMGVNADPIKFFQPSSNANELMGVFEKFSMMADEYAGIPRYMVGMGGGEGGAGRTASGMSMMIGNASKQIKATISSIDLNVTGPCVERTYQHILMHSPEHDLAGDLQVKARGAISLIAKEAAQVRLNEFLVATGNPLDMQIIGPEGRAELLRHAAKNMDINTDKVVPTMSTLRARMMMANMQAQQQPAQQPQQQPGAGQELLNGAPVTDNFQPT